MNIKREVAEKVMGWVEYTPKNSPPEWCLPDMYGATGRVVRLVSDWNPDTNWSDAGLVVERINEIHPDWRFCLLGGDTTDSGYFGWKAEWHGCYDSNENYGQRHACEYAGTAPLAICLAAIKAKEGE